MSLLLPNVAIMNLRWNKTSFVKYYKRQFLEKTPAVLIQFPRWKGASKWLLVSWASLPWHLQHIFLYCYSQMTLFLFCWNLPSNWKRVSTSSTAKFSPSCINFYITCLFFSWMIHISNFFISSKNNISRLFPKMTKSERSKFSLPNHFLHIQQNLYDIFPKIRLYDDELISKCEQNVNNSPYIIKIFKKYGNISNFMV